MLQQYSRFPSDSGVPCDRFALSSQFCVLPLDYTTIQALKPTLLLYEVEIANACSVCVALINSTWVWGGRFRLATTDLMWGAMAACVYTMRRLFFCKRVPILLDFLCFPATFALVLCRHHRGASSFICSRLCFCLRLLLLAVST